MIMNIKAKVKNSFTMGGKWYQQDEVGIFTSEQVSRLSHLLEPVVEPAASVSEKPPVDKMIKKTKIKKSEDINQ